MIRKGHRPARVRYSQPPGSVRRDAQATRMISECGEVKGVALNLKRSSENSQFRDRADPISPGAGHVAGTLMTSAASTPRGLRQHRATQRLAVNQASDDQGALGELSAKAVPEYHGQCKKRLWDGRVASDGNWSAAMA